MRAESQLIDQKCSSWEKKAKHLDLEQCHVYLFGQFSRKMNFSLITSPIWFRGSNLLIQVTVKIIKMQCSKYHPTCCMCVYKQELSLRRQVVAESERCLPAISTAYFLCNFTGKISQDFIRQSNSNGIIYSFDLSFICIRYTSQQMKRLLQMQN